MLTQERYRKITEHLKIAKSATVAELSEKLNISESTVRRDLTALDKTGALRKVHGGAVAVNADYSGSEDDVKTKERKNVPQKISIAKYAAAQITDEDFVFIDAGTTTAHMIDFIGKTKAVFVTNGIVHAKKLIQKGFTTYIIGGQLKLATEAIVGAAAIESVKSYNFTKAFMGTNGISAESGFTTPDAQEALIKREVIRHAFVSYVLADRSKFGKVSSVTFSDIESACIITDELDESGRKYSRYTVIKEATE